MACSSPGFCYLLDTQRYFLKKLICPCSCGLKEPLMPSRIYATLLSYVIISSRCSHDHIKLTKLDLIMFAINWFSLESAWLQISLSCRLISLCHLPSLIHSETHPRGFELPQALTPLLVDVCSIQRRSLASSSFSCGASWPVVAGSASSGPDDVG